MKLLQRFYTGSDGNPCAAKAQNSMVFMLIFLKLAVSGVTLFGHEFAEVTLDSMAPYLTLMGVTATGYAHRAWEKGRNSD